MAMEKRFKAVPPQVFTADGTVVGQITINDTRFFKVKQKVIVAANSLPNLDVEIKRVLDDGKTMFIGAIGKPIDDRSIDISTYTVASAANIYANEQLRPSVPEQEVERLTYEEEPTVARRTILVDALGNKIDSHRDSNGINRLAVDGQFSAEVDVQVDVDVDGTYNPTTNPDPDNIGLIGHERSLTTGQAQQTQPITAKRGDVDTDTVSMDVSLHDQYGNAYIPTNPLPVSSSYEKFFNIIAASKWMDLANFNNVVPTFVGDDLIIRYMEDDAILGEAIVTNCMSITDWQLTLYRYINNDDGTILQDDDGSALNLD